ncbi:hypothetical protein GGTG_03755 [Gaeumannomyces tritici R3-111a-1]|uniref:Mitochondrial K+-H+ exchange-related-domain-containing protein n=1 Tax=Gaeumannomyces tritici (strain R3-111a-1) TaxID=644352 RepID=J3NR50_GAET3|nr:hypothetical protein GGTG_03755 [Gaeumannomyces tritici R3-111a-1]EJT78656.1 hypothetical protein GGTG_03755 [Gaeumannomyces tritici R3-111a-1]
MRLYLLPVSTRRTLLYCKRAPAVNEKRTVMDKVQDKAARLWAGWEKKDGGWQRKVVEYGNYAFRRIPFEEWGLKSVQPLSAAVRRSVEAAAAAAAGGDKSNGNKSAKAEVVYPRTLVQPHQVSGILHTISTEREGLHRKRLIWCFVGMPFTIPVALVPIIPNLPFFYLMYRAWSHWRALAGGRHIQLLLKNNMFTLTPSPVLDQVYATQKHPLPAAPEPTTEEPPILAAGKINHPNPDAAPLHPEGETMLLSQDNGRRMTEALDLPQLEVELERAIWQVETAIRSHNGEKDAASVADNTATPASPGSNSTSSAASESTNASAESKVKKQQ